MELWTKQAHSLKEGKLRTYLKIKTNFGYENYLSIIKNFEQRRKLSKLRISAHKLQIEIGRYQVLSGKTESAAGALRVR